MSNFDGNILRSVATIFFRDYNKTKQKSYFGLRCKDPFLNVEYRGDIFPLLNTNRDDFKALFEVIAKINFHFLFVTLVPGDEKLLGY